METARGDTPLNDLRRHWGSACHLSSGARRREARRRGNGAGLTAPGSLRDLSITSYLHHPVSGDTGSGQAGPS